MSPKTSAPTLRSARWTLSFAVLTFSMMIPRALTAQEPPPPFDRGFFEVHVQGIDPLPVVVLAHEDGRVLLPLRSIAAATGIAVTVGDSLYRIALAFDQEAIFDLGRRVLRLPTGSMPLGAGDAVVFGDELFLVPALLGAALDDAVVAIDFSLLSARITRTQPFPVQQQIAMQRRRDSMRSPDAEARPETRVPYPPRSGGMVLDWSLFLPNLPDPGASQVRLNFGGAVLGGAFAVGRTFSADAAPSRDPWHYGYYRVFPNARLVRQLQIGEGIAGGIRARGIRGVVISNAELYQSPDFSSIELTPRLPPGWEYEVYDAGRLIAYSDPAQNAPVNVPLRYGRTTVEVRMYGPAGEEVRQDYHYQVPTSQLRPGRVEYTAGAGRCRSTAECSLYGVVDTRAGVTRALTVGAGTEWLNDSTGVRFNPRFEASFAATLGIFASMQYEPGRSTRGRASYSGPGPMWLSVAAGRSRFPELTGVISPTALGRRDFEVNLGLRGGGSVFSGTRLRFRVEAPLSAPADRVQVSATRDFRRGTGEVRYENLATGSSLVAFRAGYAPRTEWFGVRGHTLFANAATDRDGLRDADLSLSLPLPRSISVSTALRWQRLQNALSFDMTGSVPLSFGRATLRSRLGSGRASLGLSADGSLTASGLQAPRTRSLGSTGTAGVHGRVFYDQDGDGSYGAGDLPAPDVVVLAGAIATRTRDDGSYSTYGMAPWDPISIGIDTLRIADPAWTPLNRQQLVRATPNMSVRVDFPLVATREVYGSVLGGEGILTVGGIRVILTHESTGERVEALTFSDGEFYLSRVPPGTYSLTIAESALEILSARAEPARLEVIIPAGSGPPINIPSIQLRSTR